MTKQLFRILESSDSLNLNMIDERREVVEIACRLVW